MLAQIVTLYAYKFKSIPNYCCKSVREADHLQLFNFTELLQFGKDVLIEIFELLLGNQGPKSIGTTQTCWMALRSI